MISSRFFFVLFLISSLMPFAAWAQTSATTDGLKSDSENVRSRRRLRAAAADVDRELRAIGALTHELRTKFEALVQALDAEGDVIDQSLAAQSTDAILSIRSEIDLKFRSLIELEYQILSLATDDPLAISSVGPGRAQVILRSVLVSPPPFDPEKFIGSLAITSAIDLGASRGRRPLSEALTFRFSGSADVTFEPGDVVRFQFLNGTEATAELLNPTGAQGGLHGKGWAPEAAGVNAQRPYRPFIQIDVDEVARLSIRGADESSRLHFVSPTDRDLRVAKTGFDFIRLARQTSRLRRKGSIAVSPAANACPAFAQ